MLIERLEFIGFGNLTGQRIEFSGDKVNVVIEPNDYGKSTIAEAIWAILFDYPSELYKDGKSDDNALIPRKPMSGAAFKGLLDVSVDDRRLRIIRDFNKRDLTILDLSKDLSRAEADITDEFLDGTDKSELGLKLTGLGRELFRHTCVIGQRELSNSPFGGDRGLSSLLLNMADSAGGATTALSAVHCLEQTLAQFPYQGKTHKLDDLRMALDRGKDMLVERLKQLEAERGGVGELMQELNQIDQRLAQRTTEVNAEEYFQLCLEAAELDGRLIKAQERKAKVEDARQQLESLKAYENFPIAKMRQVDELWTKRQGRLADLERTRGELETRQRETQTRDLEFRERSEGLSGFTAADAQALTSLSRSLQQVLSEIEEIRKRRDQETQRVSETGIDLNDPVRKSLLNLDSKDLDDAHAYHDLLLASRDKFVDCERAAEKARTIVQEIQTTRDSIASVVKRFFLAAAIADLLFIGILVTLLLGKHESAQAPFAVIASTLVAILTVFCMTLWYALRFVRTRHRAAAIDQARMDDQIQSLASQEQLNKIRSFETSMDELARKAGVRSGSELVKNIQEYTTAAAQLKELDMMEQMVTTREQQAHKLREEIKTYFVRCNRYVERITPQSAIELAETVNRYLEELQKFQTSTELLDHRIAEVTFLQDELKDMDSLLHDYFQKAGLQFSSIEDGHTKLGQAVEQYRKWELASQELRRLEQDTTTDMVADELPKIVDRLESKRRDVWARMQELVSSNPNIITTPPPLSDSMISSVGKEMSDLRGSVQELQRQRDEVMLQIRVATKNYDDYYLKTLDELENLERERQRIEDTAAAINLARETFTKLAEETHTMWARKLTEISREMLRSVNSDFEAMEFDSDLQFAVRRRGHRELMRDWAMTNQLSTGAREQLHCLARMAVAKFLSKNYSLPIILDEPFSEFDDERFTKAMRFLIGSMLKQNQVILFSCHQQRHEWLVKKLDKDERKLIEVCKLESLKADAVARR